jgi:ribonuclease P protein component
MRLRAQQRLRRNADFRATREEGRRHDCGAFLLVWRKRTDRPTAPARVGVVASKAAVGGAVVRIRNTFRRDWTSYSPRDRHFST